MNKYQDMVVIFVDLLGTKNNVNFDDKFFIHQLFHSEAKKNEARNLSHVIYKRKVYSFSDCAYFFYYYKDGIEESRKDNMKLLQVAMSNTSISLLRIINAGYLVRGGIALEKAYLDELGFFGPAVEKAYCLESNYSDVPMIALSPELGKQFYEWEEKNTNMELAQLLFTDVVRLVEKDKDKYFLNLFFQLEQFSESLHLENEVLNIEKVKHNIMKTIKRDKEKYKDQSSSGEKKKATIYEKLDWFEKYIQEKHNHLKPDIVEGAISTLYQPY